MTNITYFCKSSGQGFQFCKRSKPVLLYYDKILPMMLLFIMKLTLVS